ncbi:MAG: SxtJ family membrane protein [Candidatus Omnitrophica bacterium]|nr:SxtJ family membrane protein [Candidatus Omnitrophota bacterium]
MEKININKENLKKFSITMFIALLAFGTILFLRHKNGYIWFYSIGTLLFLLGQFAWWLLKPIYIFWMRLASVLGWINTRLILFIIFYLVFTPIGLGIRLFGIDLLDRKIDKRKDSYWIKKDKKSSGYEKQF